jgi:hypothetical protein
LQSLSHCKNSANIIQSVDFILATSILTQEQRKAAFIRLGEYLKSPDDKLKHLIASAHHFNAWFTAEETSKAVKGIADMLNEGNVGKWFSSLGSEPTSSPKKIGLVLAGNLPLVGFHDVLAVLATGHIALIKLSSQDNKLIPCLLDKLKEYEPAFSEQLIFTERLDGFDAVIATGSNNSSRYFEYYFSKVPHIIRKNRNSVAVLTGQETTDELYLLGHDIFDYFGLGCRNVSKIYVPEGYNFNTFFESIEVYKNVFNHHKYANNYDYNKSIYLINNEKHYDNGFLLVKKDMRLTSPLAVLHYEEYSNMDQVENTLEAAAEQIQCVVTKQNLNLSPQQVEFGGSQRPRLWDYADGINTLDFLRSL